MRQPNSGCRRISWRFLERLLLLLLPWPAKLFLLHSLTSLSDCNCFRATFSFLKSVNPGMLPPPLVGSALACSGSILLPAGIGSVRYERNFWHLHTEVNPVAPATKALPHNPNTGSAVTFTRFSVASHSWADVDAGSLLHKAESNSKNLVILQRHNNRHK